VALRVVIISGLLNASLPAPSAGVEVPPTMILLLWVPLLYRLIRRLLLLWIPLCGRLWSNFVLPKRPELVGPGLPPSMAEIFGRRDESWWCRSPHLGNRHHLLWIDHSRLRLINHRLSTRLIRVLGNCNSHQQPDHHQTQQHLSHHALLKKRNR